MMGHNIAFASFHIIEVMSSLDFASKRIGYLAAAQSFSPTTDVLLLTTNQFKKDLTNGKMQDCSQALTCLAKLVTEDLGRDLEHDVALLLSSPRPYIRKKALLVLYRLIMVHPDTLPVVSAKFRERLTDSDPGVVCAAVTVTCELAKASPRSFLTLAPTLYQLLTNPASNNWMLIKIVKLMGVLTPLEPRLGKKLVEPLVTLMQTTRAKSLLYECCSTVTAGLMAHPEAVELCAKRLGEFMDDPDQNLKYLGLLSMRKLIQANPEIALEHRDNVLDCLDDEDVGIRMRALELVSEFVTKRTLRDISRILLRKLRNASSEDYQIPAAGGVSHSTNEFGSEGVSPLPSEASPMDQEAPFREALADQLLQPGRYARRTGGPSAPGGYAMLSSGEDFAWYVASILGGLAQIPLLSSRISAMVARQMVELTSRVETVREISVQVAVSLLSARRQPSLRNSNGVEKPTRADEADPGTEQRADMLLDDAVQSPGASNDTALSSANPTISAKPAMEDTDGEAMLSANMAGGAAWIVGEYSDLIPDHAHAMKVVVSYPIHKLDAAAQVRLLTACVKIYAMCVNEQAQDVFSAASSYVESRVESPYAEVQERAWLFKSLLREFGPGQKEQLGVLFSGKLNPVDSRAQSKIPLPSELDLDAPLLDTGRDSLYTFLLKHVGTAADEVDGDDEDGGLFCEAEYAKTTLRFGSTDPSETTSVVAAQGSLLESLPKASPSRSSPFYLGQSSSHMHDRDLVDTPNRPFEERSSSSPRYVFDTSQSSSKAAVLIEEETPYGVDLNDVEHPGLPSVGHDVGNRFQAAFEGAFQSTDTGQGSTDVKRSGKRRRKKKDKTRKIASSQHVGEANLIDFDEMPVVEAKLNQPATSASVSTTPKHLAEDWLM